VGGLIDYNFLDKPLFIEKIAKNLIIKIPCPKNKLKLLFFKFKNGG